ncbi:ABC transporter permease, partial [Rhizobium leguminosarum]
MATTWDADDAKLSRSSGGRIVRAGSRLVKPAGST